MAVSRRFAGAGIGSNLLESALEFSRIARERAGLFGGAGLRIERPSRARHGFTECGRGQSITATPSRTALLLSLRLGETPYEL